MNLLPCLAVGLKEIWAHKFRSLLTMLGIILGVSSLVAMTALVKGMENGMKENLIAMGGLDKVLLEDQQIPPYQQQYADDAVGRTINDVYALRASAPLIRLVSPEMALRGATVSYGDNSVTPSELDGVWSAALDMNLHVLQYGRFFTPLDEQRANSVCVIGTGIRDELFGSPEDLGREIVPLGRIVLINGQPFTIVGMFEHYESERERKAREWAKAHPQPKTNHGVARSRGWGRHGGWAFWRKNYTVYIPLNTMWIRFRSAAGTNNIPDPHLTDIDLKVRDLDQLETSLQQARNVLMITHHGIEDFMFQTQENNVENINAAIHNARMSGGIIAAIGLIVGGIGIMNIMLASITERVREIGIRKAIGATYADVFIQILIESVVIAVIGGLAGLGTSYGMVQALSILSPNENTPQITMPAMLIAFAFSAGVGVLAGLIPAFKAAKLDPIQALRYE
ncbi:MAG: ABC transporter permease [Verrucomicrobia bacterium]|nr:ABC transporter permease [Verrucomicrobiota bacterium]